MKIYNIYKKIGETPLEALERLRKQKKLSKAAKLTYIGRLDPMAEGVLLILQDATQADREKYMGLDKTYEVKVLFGFETDSYDLLGMPEKMKYEAWSMKQIEKILNKYKGNVKLPVPPYSSVPYKGKPLFEWARMGKKVRLPKREMEIKDIKLKKQISMSANKLLSYIQNNVVKVNGDFRQEKILKTWHKLLSKNIYKYQLANLVISVSSGTYIRSIANDLGKKLKTGAVVFSLKRTKVGKYKRA